MSENAVMMTDALETYIYSQFCLWPWLRLPLDKPEEVGYPLACRHGVYIYPVISSPPVIEAKLISWIGVLYCRREFGHPQV